MILFVKRSMLILLCLWSINLWAQSPKKNVDFSRLAKNAKVKGYVLPKPSELFAALDKQSGISWSSVIDKVNTNNEYATFAKLALNLGVRSADALVLTYIGKQNNKMLDQAGKDIQTLKKKLGIGKKALAKEERELNAAAKKGNKKEIRKKLDAFYGGVVAFLDDKKRNNHDLAVLATLGGWIEGLYVTSKALSQNYNKETSKLLRQNSVLKIYEKEIKNMSTTNQKDPSVKAIKNALPKISRIINVGRDKPVSKRNVKRLLKITQDLKKSIEKKDGKK